MNFELVKTAGLTQKEFAQLCDVNRATVNLWVAGKMRPHRYLADNVRANLMRIEHAINAGLLPLDAENGDRETRISKALTAPAATN